MLHGILDPEPGRLVFALFDGPAKLHQAECVMQPRDASGMPDFIAGELETCGHVLADVPRWTFGAGPGSFTFLRVAAALGAGWAAGHDRMKFRCLPGALALAAALRPAPGETVGAVYDGRNRELLCFGVTAAADELIPSGEERILTADAAAAYFAAHPMRLAAFAKDAPALRELLGDRVDFTVAEPDLTALALSRAAFDNDPDKMVYIRPAVAGR
ncbi:MAG: hypothetical protein MR051_03390 [Lentisphaeria bacterium]|nr:hypothetical protein [Lentisphaeria bacterium]